MFSTYGKLAPGDSTLRTYSRNQLSSAGNDPCTYAASGGPCVTYNANAPMFDLVNYTVAANAGAGSPQNSYSTVTRLDYSISDKTQIYGRYALYSELDFPGSVASSPYAGFDTGQAVFNNAFVVSLIHVFTPSLVFADQARF